MRPSMSTFKDSGRDAWNPSLCESNVPLGVMKTGPDKSEALTGICGVPDTKTGPGVTL